MNKLYSIILILLSFLVFGEEIQFSSLKIQKEITRLTKGFKVRGVTANQVKDLQYYQVLDAREKEEFQVSHLNGAQWIGYETFDINKVSMSLNKDKPILIYCSIGYRSGKLAEQLQKRGFKVVNLLGGIFEWVNYEKKLVDHKNKSTNKVHGYNKSWSRWVKKGKVIY